jgi:hypothetical protein
MRQHLLRTRQVEATIRTKLLREAGEANISSAKRVLIDLVDIRIDVLDELIAEHEAEAQTPFQVAAERVRQHFDKGFATPYKSWRGPTPVDQPSLAKDVAIIFEEMVAKGVWNGSCPNLDPKWNPLSNGTA